MARQKFLVNQEAKVRYVALNFATGLSDLAGDLRDPSGSSSSATVSEIGDGVYELSFTPDSEGLWQLKVSSSSNGDKAILSFQVVGTDITTVDGKIDNLQSSIDTANSKLDNLDTKVDEKASQSSVDTANSKLDSIETKVNNIETEVNPGGYFA